MNGSRKLPDSYSVRKNAFLAWCHKNGKSLEEMEKELLMSNGELGRKLEHREKLSKEQITQLVYVMGATDAFFVIHYPSFKFRQKVYRQVFGRKMPYRERRQARKRGEEN